MKNKKLPETKWWGWGLTDTSFEMVTRPGLLKFLARKFDVHTLKPPFEASIEQVKVPEVRLPSVVLEQFAQRLGKTVCSMEKEDRIRHAFGKNYKDLIRVRSLNLDIAPDIVLYPENEEQIRTIFDLCREHRVALIPFGGGTSVVGGVEASASNRPYVATLNTTRLDRILSIDEESLTATIEAGKMGPDLENELNEKGFTLGHFPQSFEFSTLGGWIAARSSGQNSILYGGIDKMVVSLKVLTPTGDITTLSAPSHACGPDIREILVGNEGTLGVIVSATMRIHRLPTEKLYFMYALPTFKEAARACKHIVQAGIVPALIRISDEEESEATLSMSHGSTGPFAQMLKTGVKKYFELRGLPLNGPLSLVLVGCEGNAQDNRRTKESIDEILKKYGGLPLGTGAGKKWLKDRFFLPYLRDDLLDNGLFVETLETATSWSNLNNLYRQVGNAIREVCEKEKLPVALMTHISHLYPDGASLYFSIVTKQRAGDPIGQWVDIKTAANNAIKNNGGVISHHHGVGTDHKDHLPWDKESLALVKQIKKFIDPEGLLNPDKLIP